MQRSPKFKCLFCYFLILNLISFTKCFVVRIVQEGNTATFNYTSKGLTISFGDKGKCLTDLGCFNAGPPFFHPIHRPVSLLPQDRHDVATAFLLYTRDNPNLFQFLRAGEAENILKSHFRLEAETKIIVPGWMDSLKVSNWMQDMKDALLNYADCNVIIVDWSKNNGIPFALAVANTRVVGAEIALLVNFLQDTFDCKTERFHIIGHSLGTEIAGYAGQRINNLGRITALDPAGPHFRKAHPEVRLDPGDAIFVDAIHTQSSDDDLEAPSRLEQTGHIDFYPNGGEIQPGCPKSILETIAKNGILEGTRNLLVCDHYRVIDYFIATIPNHYGCRPTGIACDSWESFTSGRCTSCGVDGELCAVMGFQADIQQERIKKYPPRKFYLYTSPRPPFCVQQYHVSVRLSTVPSSTPVVGDLYVKLIGKFGSVLSHVNERNGLLNNGKFYRAVVTTDEDISVTSIVFYWTCATLRLTENIVVNVSYPRACKLSLHSIKITTFKPNPSPNGDSLTFCGPNSYIQPNVELKLGLESLCPF